MGDKKPGSGLLCQQNFVERLHVYLKRSNNNNKAFCETQAYKLRERQERIVEIKYLYTYVWLIF